MNGLHYFISRSLPRVVTLTALATVLAGCNSHSSEQVQVDQPVLPPAGIASSTSVLLNASPSEIRHRQRLPRAFQSHHRLRAQVPQGPMAIN